MPCDVSPVAMFFFRKTPKGGWRGLAESEISLSEKTGASELLRGGGGGGVSEFRSFSEKEKQFFFMPPLRVSVCVSL